MERDAYKAECDVLKRKCEELRQDLERVKLHACKGPFGKGPMPDVDGVGHEDKKAKSQQEQVNDVSLIFKQHAITNSFAGQEDHHGNMLPESPPESLTTSHFTTMLLLPDPVPDQEHPSDELEPLDLGQLDRQLDLGDMSLWSIPNGPVTRIKAASDADTQHSETHRCSLIRIVDPDSAQSALTKIAAVPLSSNGEGPPQQPTTSPSPPSAAHQLI